MIDPFKIRATYYPKRIIIAIINLNKVYYLLKSSQNG